MDRSLFVSKAPQRDWAVCGALEEVAGRIQENLGAVWIERKETTRVDMHLESLAIFGRGLEFLWLQSMSYFLSIFK